jgi:hypothetical protein
MMHRPTATPRDKSGDKRREKERRKKYIGQNGTEYVGRK